MKWHIGGFRVDKVLNLQMSLFGSFINIKPETDIVINLLTSLKEDKFIPGSADIASVDLKTGKMNVESRMQMISPDKTWSIVFLPERIDFNYNYQEGTTVFKNINAILAYGNTLVEKVFRVFSAITGNRLALNCKLALENMTPDDMMQFCGRFTKPLNAYNGDSFAEWSVRFNARGKCEVEEGKEEDCNRIAEMMQVENQSETENAKSIILSVDVNTLPSNLALRFKYENLRYFVNSASKFISEVTDEIERG